MGDDERGAYLGARLGHGRVAQPARVVHHRRAGAERRARDLGLPGVHRHERTLGGEPLDERDYPPRFLVGSDRRQVAHARLAAHVHDRGAGRGYLPGAGEPRLGARVAAAVVEGLGRRVHDAHQRRATGLELDLEVERPQRRARAGGRRAHA